MRTVDLQYDTIMFENCKRVFFTVATHFEKQISQIGGSWHLENYRTFIVRHDCTLTSLLS